MSQGIRTSANEIYVLDEVKADGRNLVLRSEVLARDFPVEVEATARFLQGREIKPYEVLPSGKRVIMPYRIKGGKAILIPEHDFKERNPRACAYLLENKKALEEREDGRFKGPEWHQFGRNQNIDLMLVPKILVPDIADRAAFALDEEGQYAFTSGYGITLKPDRKESLKYVLGLLNSKVLDFYLKRVSTTMQRGFFRYFTQFIGQLPIRTIDFADARDKGRHDRMVGLVDQMLDLHKRRAAARIEQDRASLQRQIDATSNQIDALVYELYDLVPEETAMLEERNEPSKFSYFFAD